MGQLASCCSADLFAELQKQYGEDFTKLILAQKAKAFINTHFKQLTHKFSTIFQQFTNQTTGIVTGKKTQLRTLYDNLKSKVDNTLPGGISMLEKIKGEPIDQFSGYNTLQSKIDAVQSEALGKVQAEKTQLQGQMQGRKGEMIQRINDSKPKIEYYDSLPEGVQDTILLQAESILGKQISQNQELITQQIAKQFNPANVAQLFTKINPTQQCSGILAQAVQLLSGAMTGGGAGGAIASGLAFLRG